MKPINADMEGSSAANGLGFLRYSGGQVRIFLGTDLDQGRLVLDFLTPFTDGPGDDFAILTAPYPDGSPAPKIMFEFFHGGVLQDYFSATLVPDQLFQFDLPGTDLIADRIVVTNITPDPPGINNLGGVAFDDAAVAHLVQPEPPRFTLTDLDLFSGTESVGLAINSSGQVTGPARFSFNTTYHAFLFSGGSMNDLGTLGGSWSEGDDINASGMITGISRVAGNGTYHAFLYSGGQMRDLGTLGGSWSSGSGINELGQVSGTAALAGDSTERAFLFSSGSMMDIGTLGGSSSRGGRINNAGEITGRSSLAGEVEQHAFLYSGGTMIDLGTLGGTLSGGGDINELGEVTGTSLIAGDGAYRAFLYSGSQMIDLGTLPRTSPYSIPDSFGAGINRRSQVVGQSGGEGELSRGFLYSAGVMYDLNELVVNPGGWEVVRANDINDAGQIVGTAYNVAKQQGHGVLLTPIQNPLLAVSADDFYEQAIASQQGTFTFFFEATPALNSLDAVIGLSRGSPASYRDLAVIIRFNSAGAIDARNGGRYAAASRIPYAAGSTYRFRVVVHVATHNYSAYVTPPGGPELTVGSEFAFRSEQSRVPNLDTCAVALTEAPVGAALTVGNVSVASRLETGSSLIAKAGGGFQQRQMATQTGTFEVTFDAGASKRPLDGVIGLSSGPATSYTDLAAIVRFNPSGYIDARNGDAYAAATRIRYAAGLTYHFRMVVDVAAHRYSVYVTPPGGAELNVGTHFAFRSEQDAVPNLNSWAMIVDPGRARGSVTAGNFNVTAPM